jgi:phosphoribosylformimino-5-aminoimidazole carboxamide ribotide isomerase
MKLRPCIDLHQGRVKQIVGATLSESSPAALRTNFIAHHPPSWYARLYKKDRLNGGHLIMLGAGNETAATEALAAWPGGLQIGGGITGDNAAAWLNRGASHVIVTSWVFRDGLIDESRLARLTRLIGTERLVLDLSCRRMGDEYLIVTDRWQRFTQVRVDAQSLVHLAGFCAEFLVHAVDVEGRQAGVDLELIGLLARHSPIATTYAGGVRNLDDLAAINRVGRGRIDATVGSALDIFGGPFAYGEALAFHRQHNQSTETASTQSLR